MQDYEAVIISGPSGAGKTVLLNKLLEEDPRFQKVVTTTTRLPRNEEKHGKDYNFITLQEFTVGVNSGDFLEHALVHGKDYYGNRWSDLQHVKNAGKIPVYIIDVQGAETMRGKIKTLSIFIEVPGLPSTDELVKRLIKRGENPDSFANRMASVPLEMSKRASYDFVILNDVFDRAYQEMSKILKETFG